MLEDALEAIWRGILTVVRFIFWDILFETICFYLGRFTLLLFTLGHYPRGTAVERDINFIGIVGLVVLAFIWVAIALVDNQLAS